MSEKKYKPQLIARESAIKILYQMKIQDETSEKIMNGFIEKREYDETLLDRILSEYVENKNKIISLLDKKAEVSLENIPLLDECIIHLSVCEFLFINKSSVGIILLILVSSVMIPFFKGTFKSNLSKTVL